VTVALAAGTEYLWGWVGWSNDTELPVLWLAVALLGGALALVVRRLAPVVRSLAPVVRSLAPVVRSAWGRRFPESR
jgi:hypothetical protein